MTPSTAVRTEETLAPGAPTVVFFDGLAAAVDGLEVPVDPVALRELIGIRDRLNARIGAAVAVLDEARLWEVDGATSMTGWLKVEAGQSARSAGRTVHTARRLARLELTAAAFAGGALSSGQVDTILGLIPPRLDAVFADHEAGLLPRLVGLSTVDTATVVRVWVERADAEGTEPPPERTELHLSTVGDTPGVLKGTLGADGAATVGAALRLAMTPYARDDPRSLAERRADAALGVRLRVLTPPGPPYSRRPRTLRPAAAGSPRRHPQPNGALTGELAHLRANDR